MKQKLLILSDLWGAKKASYLPKYITLLQSKFDVEFLDCCQLGEIDTTNYTQENLHQQFINGGINLAIENLLKNYPQEVDILAFSIGGTIAWKANLAGLKIKNLYAISATRLRYETERPNSQISLVYGGLDTYRPNENWFVDLEITDYGIFENEGHNLYQKPTLINQLLSRSYCNL